MLCSRASDPDSYGCGRCRQDHGWQPARATVGLAVRRCRHFHPAANVEKIRNGIALDDSDRAPWLAALHDAILRWNLEGKDTVLACSALKRKYRDVVRADGVQFVYLKGDCELIQRRLRSRHGHFASDSILKSQFEDLETPTDAITVEIDKTPEAIVSEIIDKLKSTSVAYSDRAQK